MSRHDPLARTTFSVLKIQELFMSKKPYHIMVIDDEPEISTGLAETLSALTGHRIEAFSDPCLALQSFLKNPFHLVLTDISMPHLEGFELLRRIKEQAPHCDFIVITAHKTLEVVSRSRRLGAAYIFYKPVDIEALEEAINHMHKRHCYWEELLAELEGN